MKRTFTSRPFLAKQMIIKTTLLLFCAVFAVFTAFGQTTPSQDVGDLSGMVWKSAANVNQAIAQEQAKMDVALTAPGMSLDERALFLSYRRLVSYIQTDVQGGMPVQEAVVTNYEKVLAEAPADPDLKHLPPGLLRTFLPGLIEILQETPTPQALGN